MAKDDYDKLTTIKVCKKQFEVQAFHPKAFEDNAYTVRFHEKGQPWTDRFSHHTMVVAHSRSEAIKRGKNELHRDLCR